jgi:hypothetical protein
VPLNIADVPLNIANIAVERPPLRPLINLDMKETGTGGRRGGRIREVDRDVTRAALCAPSCACGGGKRTLRSSVCGVVGADLWVRSCACGVVRHAPPCPEVCGKPSVY